MKMKGKWLIYLQLEGTVVTRCYWHYRRHIETLKKQMKKTEIVLCCDCLFAQETLSFAQISVFLYFVSTSVYGSVCKCVRTCSLSRRLCVVFVQYNDLFFLCCFFFGRVHFLALYCRFDQNAMKEGICFGLLTLILLICDSAFSISFFVRV